MSSDEKYSCYTCEFRFCFFLFRLFFVECISEFISQCAHDRTQAGKKAYMDVNRQSTNPLCALFVLYRNECTDYTLRFAHWVFPSEITTFRLCCTN